MDEDQSTRLSVGETRVVRSGRPVLTVTVTAAVIVAVGLVGFASLRGYHGHLDKGVSDAAEKSVGIVVRAEAGHAGTCPLTPASITGHAKAECEAVFGDDQGVELQNLTATSVHRHGQSGTVDLRGTLVDAAGTRPFDHQVTMVKQNGVWLLDWDGSPLAVG